MFTLLRSCPLSWLLIPAPSSKPLCRASHFSLSRSSLYFLSLSSSPSHHLTSSSCKIRCPAATASKKEVPAYVEAEVLEESESDSSAGQEGEEQNAEEWEKEEFVQGDNFRGREEDVDYDRDPEFAEILGSYFDDPQKAQARVEERIRKKKNKILQTKTGSAESMKVIFDKFKISNSYIWLEFYSAPLGNDVSLICNAIRSWHIIGRLGGCNSMNMQLSQLPLDHKRPTYDAIQGANVTPTTFYNIGDLEIQDNLARIWVDIGTSEPLLLDVLINALTQINSDGDIVWFAPSSRLYVSYVGIKQVVFGGSGFENWKENFTSEDGACSIHKI